MFLIPSPPKEQDSPSSRKSSSDEDSLELEIDLPAPSTKDNARSTLGQRSAFNEPIAEIPLGADFVSQSNTTRRTGSAYGQIGKTKYSSSGALFLTLFILASIMLAGGAIAGAVVVTKSFLASMPRTLAVPKLGADVSDTEATEAASKWIHNAFSTAHTPLLEDQTLDEETLLTLALDKVSLSPAVREAMIDKMKPIVKSVCGVNFDADDWSVLQTTADKTQPTVSLRLRKTFTGELAYVRVRCRRSQDFEVRVCDVDCLDGHGWASEQLKRHLIAIPNARQAVIDTFSPVDGFAEDSMVEKLATICALPSSPAPGRVASYKGLLTSYALQPAIHRLHVMSCFDPESGESFSAAYSAYKSMHPSDNELSMFAINHLPTRGIFDSLDSDIDAVEQIVGKDPYLDWYRALSAIANNRYDASVRLLEKVSSQSWAPQAAKLLLAYAYEPTGLRPSVTVPIFGDRLAATKNLLVKPKSSDEITIDAMDAYNKSQAEESFREADSARRERMREQMELEAYNRSQAESMPEVTPPTSEYGPNYNPSGETSSVLVIP